MNCSFIKKVTIFVFPASVLGAVYAFLPIVSALPASLFQILPYITYAILAMGILLSLHFNRSRAFFVFVMLALFYWNAGSLSEGAAAARRVDSILCFLLPVNITLFCFMREKGLFTSAGRKRLIFLLLQAAVVIIAGRTGQAEAQQASAEWLRRGLGSCRELPNFAVPVLGVCGALVAAKSYVRQSLLDSAFLGTSAALTIIFASSVTAEEQALLLIGAGLILVVSILQDSHDMAYRDDLTGLLSRRALNEHLESLGRCYAIAMLDLDHFKKLNDTFGHDVGDQVLRMAAARIRAAGGGGKAYRYGGEEFTILFQGKGIDDVLPHLEALRRDIASYRFTLRGPDRPVPAREGKKLRMGAGSEVAVSVTVSIGVAESGRSLKSCREVLRAADQALYRAKQKGRNRVSAAPVG